MDAVWASSPPASSMSRSRGLRIERMRKRAPVRRLTTVTGVPAARLARRSGNSSTSSRSMPS